MKELTRREFVALAFSALAAITAGDEDEDEDGNR